MKAKQIIIISIVALILLGCIVGSASASEYHLVDLPNGFQLPGVINVENPWEELISGIVHGILILFA